jgi:threonine synthase
MTIRYSCISCGREYRTDEAIYRCPSCEEASESAAARVGPTGGFAKGALVTIFDPKGKPRRGEPVNPLSFLPLPIAQMPAFPVGNTPLARPPKLLQKAGFPNLCFKLDNLNPSGSLKDRASILVASQAALLGEKRVALASTGNAGASMACAGAACGLEVVLFVPASAPRAKLLQSLLFGARVVPVSGTYDQAFSLSIEYTKARGGINRNTAYNPLTIEGKKTVSLEIYNQLGCEAPDCVYVPAGDGVIFAGVHKGFADLVAAGLAPRVPTLVMVQAEGSNAIARSFREGRQVVLSRASTYADSISVASPANGEMALDCLRKSGGRAVEVSDREIAAAQAELAREGGIFVEPSSAAAWAGFLKDRGNVDPQARVVVLLTGTGFKDLAAAETLVFLPAACEPRLASALETLETVYGD